jgi:hypothetical protein
MDESSGPAREATEAFLPYIFARFAERETFINKSRRPFSYAASAKSQIMGTWSEKRTGGI